MIESVEFRHFKVLRNTTLPLQAFTLLIGPNGSGKSTALQGLHAAGRVNTYLYERIVSKGDENSGKPVSVKIRWLLENAELFSESTWTSGALGSGPEFVGGPPTALGRISTKLSNTRK